MNKTTSTIFLSYCSKDSEIADLVENALHTRLGEDIRISRYTRDVGYRDSFREFMNTVSIHDFVLCIVSDSYLKSYPCLYEVGETLRNRDYEKRLLFFLLGNDDSKYYSNENYDVAANIYSAEGRISYITYWENEYKKLQELIKTIKSESAQVEERKRLAKIDRIINFDLPEFMACLQDRRGIPFGECVATSFEDVVIAINPDAGNILSSFLDYESLFLNAIKRISKITGTDYNQIILRAKINSYELGLVVFADYIASNKQKYRITALNGLISKAIDSGEIINIANIENDEEYFTAVIATRSELVVPISINSRIIGAINSESEKVGHFTPEIVSEMVFLSRCIATQLKKLGYHTRMDYRDIPYISDEVRPQE